MQLLNVTRHATGLIAITLGINIEHYGLSSYRAECQLIFTEVSVLVETHQWCFFRWKCLFYGTIIPSDALVRNDRPRLFEISVCEKHPCILLVPMVLAQLQRLDLCLYIA